MTDIIDIIRQISDSEHTAQIEFDDGTELELDTNQALEIIDVFESLDDEERLNFIERGSVSADEFLAVIDEHKSELDEEVEYGESDEND